MMFTEQQSLEYLKSNFHIILPHSTEWRKKSYN